MLFLLLLACTGTPEPAETAPVLTFSAIPDQDTARLKERFDPVAAHLSEALGVPVAYVPATDYTASVEMFRSGDIQLAWFGGLTGVQARQAVPGAQAIAQGVEDPQYRSYFIAHESTGLQASEAFPEAIGGLTFSFGSESSTSGRLMPEHFIRQHTGRAPADFFTAGHSFSGAHDKTAKLVESGQVQAGVLSYTTWDAMVAEGRLDLSQAHIIWTTPAYADYNFTAHPDLETRYGEGFTDRLAAVLVDITDPALLSAFQRSGLIAAQDSDYDTIAAVAQELDMVR
ncbi:MAG: putative selenate ABC transporter substrate-binding protein [Myxococcota bacterium]|nr:putative selenate ABC transporter substrate-binding protein [Myxococcota bacterium]